MVKTINFAAGPAKVPEQVMEQAHREFLNYDGTGISVMELSHRSATFMSIITEAETNLRSLYQIPPEYAVLFMHGGGVGGMASVPLNLSDGQVVDYIETGAWSQKAGKEAMKYAASVNVHDLTGKGHDLRSIPSSDATKYVYYCDNETIHGVEFPSIPSIKSSSCEPLLVADLTSNFLTRPLDVTKFKCIFAGTQKNAGIAALAIVIVRKDAIKPLKVAPSILDFNVTIKNGSMQNTPPCYPIYMANLCLKWIISNGGLEGMDTLANKRSQLIYGVIDASNGFYTNPVDKEVRSRLTIPFRVGPNGGDEALEKIFLKEAESLGMIQLKGHRSVGGIRASMYNAMTLDEVKVLKQFMLDFQAKHFQ